MARNPYFNLIKAVWKNGKPWRQSIVGYYLAYIIAQGFFSLSPYAFGRTIDVLQHFTPARFNEVIFWLSVGVAVFLLFWLFHGPARIKERFVALRIQQAYRTKIYEQLTQLPLKWHQDHHSGNIITRVNRSALALYRFAENQFIYVEICVQLLAALGFLFWISPVVGLFSILTCVLTAVTIYVFDKKLIPLYEAENEIDNRVGAVVFDYLSNMTTILTLRLGELTKNNLVKRIMQIWPIFRKEVVMNEVKWFSTGLVLSLLQALVLIGYIVYNLRVTDTILIGSVVMIFRYQQDLSWVFYTLSSNYSELVRMDTDIQGLQPILDDIKRFAHHPKGKTIAKQWHHLSIEHLSFHHMVDEKHKHIFDNLSLDLKRGEKIALIGESGGGKSTLLNLLRGLYLPDHVQLTIDDVSFNTLEPLQAITTLIPQDPEIFENTLAFNITMDVATDLAEIEKAIALARFDKVLATLPLGLETDIREKGLNLSVGQKQRLALARGLFAARYSSLILMDEPTSSVDLQTEKEILSGVLDTFSDTAMIVSLHRLHLLPKFDRIIMLSHGKIVDAGATGDVLKRPGPIQQLWLTYQDKS